MKAKRLTRPDGVEISVRDVDWDRSEEPWATYHLTDGGTIRLRATALTISRILDSDGKPSFMPDGQPAVWVNYNVSIVASD